MGLTPNENWNWRQNPETGGHRRIHRQRPKPDCDACNGLVLRMARTPVEPLRTETQKGSKHGNYSGRGQRLLGRAKIGPEFWSRKFPGILKAARKKPFFPGQGQRLGQHGDWLQKGLGIEKGGTFWNWVWAHGKNKGGEIGARFKKQGPRAYNGA